MHHCCLNGEPYEIVMHSLYPGHDCDCDGWALPTVPASIAWEPPLEHAANTILAAKRAEPTKNVERTLASMRETAR